MSEGEWPGTGCPQPHLPVVGRRKKKEREEEEEETRNESERGQKGFSSGGKEGVENDGKRINLPEGILLLFGFFGDDRGSFRLKQGEVLVIHPYCSIDFEVAIGCSKKRCFEFWLKYTKTV
ncbi:hypothetical protein NL676_037910 [Syzygium grande]|nr:hypothetical protein NL676_037910 [Syzygium grande]